MEDAASDESKDDASPAADESKLTDLDPDQREAAVEQFEVVSDQSPLEKQDMGAYWRLVMWTKAQTFKALEARARRDVLFTHLAQEPAKYRGQILRLDLHVRRTLTYETEGVLPGVTRMYEAWGPTKESRPNWPYCVVFPEAPAGLQFGANVKQRAVFAGYFLKLIAYEAADGKTRWAPLLIGRLEYDKSATAASEPEESNNNVWIWAAGGIIVSFFAVRMLLALRPRKPIASRLRGVLTGQGGSDAEPADVEKWLSNVEDLQNDAEINDRSIHEHNGNGAGQVGAQLDWPSERER
jgi:hypothetical protein